LPLDEEREAPLRTRPDPLVDLHQKADQIGNQLTSRVLLVVVPTVNRIERGVDALFGVGKMRSRAKSEFLHPSGHDQTTKSSG